MIASSAVLAAIGMLAAQSTTASPLDGVNYSLMNNMEARATNTSAGSGPYGLNNVQCSTVKLQVTANSNNIQFTNVTDTYSTVKYVSQQILEYTTAMSNWTSEHMTTNATVAHNATYSIRGHYCEPLGNKKANSSLIVGVHGVGFDASYWDFAYKPSYSFVKHAASYGYTSFIYDRLGCGGSEAPAQGGFSAMQAPTEVAVLKDILTQLRNTTTIGGKSHSKITLMGHSYGSAQSQAISADYPDLIDGLVLTGFSTNGSSTPSFFQSATYTPAKNIADLPQLKSRPDIWLGTASAISDLELFFDPPNYDDGAFELARQTAQPVTLGSLTTISAIAGVAKNYTGPVYVIDGERDLPFCGRNCFAPVPASPDENQASAVKALYPSASNFSSFILPETGHGIVVHRTSALSSELIMDFIISNNL
ncbi:hypothetical protein CBS101457_005431 [Exobasidium rhododendri]|nr:hypothetical protein CBS101457_005431 [Exobasidium rhododendri]